jgi:hypothetical protein
MQSLWTGGIAVGCVGFIVVIPIAARSVTRLSGEELLGRLNAARFPKWQRHLILAGLGWCAAGFAMAAGVLAAIVSSWVESRALELTAGAILLVWILLSLASTLTSTTGRPKLLLLPQLRGYQWTTLTRPQARG